MLEIPLIYDNHIASQLFIRDEHTEGDFRFYPNSSLQKRRVWILRQHIVIRLFTLSSDFLIE